MDEIRKQRRLIIGSSIHSPLYLRLRIFRFTSVLMAVARSMSLCRFLWDDGVGGLIFMISPLTKWRGLCRQLR